MSSSSLPKWREYMSYSDFPNSFSSSSILDSKAVSLKFSIDSFSLMMYSSSSSVNVIILLSLVTTTPSLSPMALKTRITSASDAPLMSIVSSSSGSIPVISSSPPSISGSTMLGSSIPGSTMLGSSIPGWAIPADSGSSISSCSIRDSFTSELISFLIVEESIPCAFLLRDSSKFFIWNNASSTMFFSPIDIFFTI